MKQKLMFALSAVMLLISCGPGKQNSNEQQSAANSKPDGKALFAANCQQCHALKQDKLGPKLEGVVARWKGDTSQVRAFIKNSQQVINSGNTYAARLYGIWNNAMMPPFSTLSDAEINAILEYINKGVE